VSRSHLVLERAWPCLILSAHGTPYARRDTRNVERASSDWRSLVIRRASKKSVEEGGWNIFGTGWTGVETLDPSADLPLAANGAAAWFSWPDDEKLEALRTEWLKTPDSEAREEIAVKIQARAFETLPCIPTG